MISTIYLKTPYLIGVGKRSLMSKNIGGIVNVMLNLPINARVVSNPLSTSLSTG